MYRIEQLAQALATAGVSGALTSSSTPLGRLVLEHELGTAKGYTEDEVCRAWLSVAARRLPPQVRTHACDHRWREAPATLRRYPSVTELAEARRQGQVIAVCQDCSCKGSRELLKDAA
jgi:hypothetical protein